MQNLQLSVDLLPLGHADQLELVPLLLGRWVTPRVRRAAEQQPDATAKQKVGEHHAKSNEIVTHGSHDCCLHTAVAARSAIDPTSDRLQNSNQAHPFGFPVNSREQQIPRA